MELLKTLTQLCASGGREEAVHEFIKDTLMDMPIEIKTDALGNLICHKEGSGKRLMLTANMDETGIMAKYTDNMGFVRFARVGAVSKHDCINRRIVFQNGTRGVISYENREDAAAVDFDKMYIDIGANSKEEAEKKVSVGDMAVFDTPFEVLGNAVSAKALSGRIGCYILIKLLKEIAYLKVKNDIYAVFTVQNTLGLRGAKTAPYGINPDMAISLSTSQTGDTPSSKELNVKLGGGAVIRIKDGTYIIHPFAKKFMLDCARQSNILYQIEVSDGGTSDAGAMQFCGGGVPVGTLALPLRYKYSPCELAAIDDINENIRLVNAMCSTPIADYIA